MSLYATDTAAEEVRPTDDVDIVVELTTYGAFAALEERLRGLGFVNDDTSGVICRYRVQGFIVDVMPTDGSFLGFNSRWYPEGFKTSVTHPVDDISVRIFTAPYFLAAKLEAFGDRGNNDGRTSTDFEDIIYILNNRPEIWTECASAPQDVRDYLATSFAELLAEPSIEEWLSCHLEFRFAYEQAERILEGMRNFVQGLGSPV